MINVTINLMKVILHSTMRNNLVFMNCYFNSRAILLSNSKKL
ncbi:hypothetical protein EMIT0180MI3_340015 [Priestia megaterium]